MTPEIDRRSLLRAAGAATAGGALLETVAASDDDPATGDHFEVGADRVDASPLPEHLEEGVHLGGFGIGPVREAQGVHDGCFARAIAVTVDDRTAVLAMLDVVGLGNVQMAAIRRRAAERTGVDEQHLLIGATHTHAGPDFQGLWGGVPESYREYVVGKMVDAIAGAVERQRPATARVGSVEAPNSSNNRRGWGFNTETLTAMQFTERGETPGNAPDGVPAGEDGDVIATLVSYAAHPVVIGSDNDLVATDYIGPLERSLENEYGGVGVFYAGAIGDASPSGASGETDFEAAVDYGETLAGHAKDALGSAEAVAPRLGIRTGTVRLPLDNCLFKGAFTAGFLRPYYTGETPSGTAASAAASAVGGVSERGGRAISKAADEAPAIVPQAIHSPIARLSLGTDPDVELLTVPGEALTRLGLELEEIADSDYRFLLGLTSNTLGYFVPQDEWGERDDHYEETVSMGPDSAPIYRNGVRGLFDEPREPFERSDVGERTCPATQLELEAFLADLEGGEMAVSVCCAGEDHDHE